MRFKEYYENWTIKPLGAVCKFLKGRGISKEDLSNTGNPCILYGELYTTYKTAIIKDIKSKTLLELKSLVRSKSNDVLIPCSGETAEDIATSICVPYDDVLIGGDLTIIRSELNGAFLSNQINSVRKLNIAKVAQGKSIVHLQADELKKINISFPRIAEQQKIANFIDLLDQRIDTQSKIIEDLESKIEWIRNEIFGKNYKSFNHTLSDYLSEYTERNINSFYTPVAVGKYGIRKREDIYSKELASDYSKNKVIRQNTLIIGMGSTQIDIGILLSDEIYCVSPAYTTYKIKNINASYLNELLIFLNPLLSKKYMIISSRQGKSVNKKELLAHKTFIHINEIQIKIAELFHFLYAKIKKEKDILELYKKQKAYLLKNMFI